MRLDFSKLGLIQCQKQNTRNLFEIRSRLDFGHLLYLFELCNGDVLSLRPSKISFRGVGLCVSTCALGVVLHIFINCTVTKQRHKLHLHWFVSRLKVECCHLWSDIPHRDGVVVWRVDSLGFRVDSAQLDLVIPEEHLTRLQAGDHHLLREGGHLVRYPLLAILVSGKK